MMLRNRLLVAKGKDVDSDWNQIVVAIRMATMVTIKGSRGV
jgi:hypothetical protein